MITQSQIKTEAPPACTCANCPQFKNYGDPSGKGWCKLFDKPARSHHALTQDCLTSLPDTEEEVEREQSEKVGCVLGRSQRVY
ncbi:MAG: hypothetical protein QNJ32_23965 [Xenococcaceae cyanobacterium MO_167.B27]|nr:hypothetical protein [Xenococcaceae cyanobacterium MO_167.B27]